MKRGFLTKCACSASCSTTPLKGPELLLKGSELLYKGPELKCKHVTTYWMEDGVGVEGGFTGAGQEGAMLLEGQKIGKRRGKMVGGGGGGGDAAGELD